MALNSQQVANLNALNQKIATGYKATTADQANLAYATKQGYKYTPMVSGATKISSPSGLTGLNESQIYRSGANIYKLPTAISSDAITGKVAPTIQAVTPDPLSVSSLMTGIEPGNKGIEAQLLARDKVLQEQTNLTEIQKRQADYTDTQKTAQRDLQEQKWSENGLNANVAEVQKIMPQIAKTTAEFNSLQEQNANLPIANRIIGGTQDKLTRQKAIEVAGLSAVAQAYQGNVDMARNIAQDAVNAQYQDQSNYFNSLSEQIRNSYTDLNAAEKKRADELLIVNNERLRNIEVEKEEKNNISSLAITLANKGINSSIINSVLKAPTYEDAIIIASQSGGLKTIGEWTDLGNGTFSNTVTGEIKTTTQINNIAKLGQVVGTIMGLNSYDTRATNPGVNRSDRNNNPGNIKVSEYTKTFDGVAGVESSPAQDGGNFLIFDSPESGINAIGQLLLTGKSYKGVTAEQAIKKYNGGGAYGALDLGLIPNGDFQGQIKDPVTLKAVATAIAKAEGFTGTNTTSTSPLFSPGAMAYARDVFDGKMTIANVPQDIREEVVLAKEELMKTDKPKQDKLKIDDLTEKINMLSDVSSKVSTDGKGAVGPSRLSRLGLFSFNNLSGRTQNFIAGVEQLIKQETIDKLIQSKAAGATYGALSDGEREMLVSAASKIGTWRIVKNGQVVGYNISESSMKAELDRIKRLAEKAKKVISGDLVQENENDPLDLGINNISNSTNPLGIQI